MPSRLASTSADAEPAGLGLAAGDQQGVDRVDRDVGGEQEELDGDELAGLASRPRRRGAGSGEPPDDDDAGDSLDDGVEPEAEQGDRSGHARPR